MGVVHTLLGPDHYLPFVVLGRARGWSPRRTAGVTLTCGLAHVASALLLGLGGIALGGAVSRLTHLEELRGSLTAWLLIAVGLVYGAWGLRRALRGERHVTSTPSPSPTPIPTTTGTRTATRTGTPPGTSMASPGSRATGGPSPRGCSSSSSCSAPVEPLIPLVMVPAAAGSVAGVVVVSVVFSIATLVAMLAAVTVGRRGLDLLPLGRLERYTHAFAGAAIFVSGVGVRLLGW